jgi:hypothetical protein
MSHHNIIIIGRLHEYFLTTIYVSGTGKASIAYCNLGTEPVRTEIHDEW